VANKQTIVADGAKETAMKAKRLLVFALVVLLALPLTVQAGWRIGIGIGIPFPFYRPYYPYPVYVAPPPVYYAPAPVYVQPGYAQPVYVQPGPYAQQPQAYAQPAPQSPRSEQLLPPQPVPVQQR
jgi:hypothetical protein